MSQKRDYFSREYIFQPLIFRGNVSFQGSRWLYIELSGSDLLRLIIWAVVRYPADKKLHPPKIRKHHLGHLIYIYIYLHPTYINKKILCPCPEKKRLLHWRSWWRSRFSSPSGPSSCSHGPKTPELHRNKRVSKAIHSARLTWNLRITCLKRNNIFQTNIFGFYVYLWECIQRKWCEISPLFI